MNLSSGLGILETLDGDSK